jgi:hypothetical protein
VRHFEFVNYDDPEYVTGNPHIHEGVNARSFVWAFTTNRDANWFPLTWLSHMADWQMFGSNAGGHHRTNVLFHMANTVLLFLVFRRMTASPWRSAFVAEPVCFAPPARGIGRMGVRTEGCPQRVFLDIHDVDLRQIRERIQVARIRVQDLLWTGGVVFCVGVDGQTEAGDLAVCVVVAGLLATRSDEMGPSGHPPVNARQGRNIRARRHQKIIHKSTCIVPVE